MREGPLTGLKPHYAQDIRGFEYLSNQPAHRLGVDKIPWFLPVKNFICQQPIAPRNPWYLQSVPLQTKPQLV